MITEHDCLTEEECLNIATHVRNLKEYWYDRGLFYTLGAASYLDPMKNYYTLARLYNPILDQFYSMDEFQKIRQVMEDIFEDHIVVHPSLALAGFHIFDKRSNGHKGSMHEDTQFERIGAPEYTETITFTLPVELPRVGGGLNYDYEYVPYTVGKMYKHDGLTTHQIAQRGDLTDDLRITLQGHGLRLKTGGVLVYW
jgi:hypothetical protein